MQMTPASAAAVMAQFSESEAEDIAAEIVRLRRVPSTVADHVINEFHGLAVSGRRSARGGQEFAVGLLEASFGADKAAGFMDRLASTMAGKSFEFLEMMDPGQILALIDGELPQTIALILTHLRPGKAPLSCPVWKMPNASMWPGASRPWARRLPKPSASLPKHSRSEPGR